jgi:DNA-binding winged helix-turn-helix (wHTH) protein
MNTELHLSAAVTGGKTGGAGSAANPNQPNPNPSLDHANPSQSGANQPNPNQARADQTSRNGEELPARYARFGAFQLDLKRQDLTKNGARLRVPGKVCQVLITLLERSGEIVTREELRARLWASDTHVNFDANVNTTVNKLRQILGDSNEESLFVQTIPRKGYSFIGGVEFFEQPESAASGTLPASDDGRIASGANADDAGAVMPAGISKLFAPHRSRVWFTAGIVALVIAAMLFGAAITLFSYRPF